MKLNIVILIAIAFLEVKAGPAMKIYYCDQYPNKTNCKKRIAALPLCDSSQYIPKTFTGTFSVATGNSSSPLWSYYKPPDVKRTYKSADYGKTYYDGYGWNFYKNVGNYYEDTIPKQCREGNNSFVYMIGGAFTFVCCVIIGCCMCEKKTPPKKTEEEKAAEAAVIQSDPAQ